MLMFNLEYYLTAIEAINLQSKRIALKDGKPVACTCNCQDCDFANQISKDVSGDFAGEKTNTPSTPTARKIFACQGQALLWLLTDCGVDDPFDPQDPAEELVLEIEELLAKRIESRINTICTRYTRFSYYPDSIYSAKDLADFQVLEALLEIYSRIRENHNIFTAIENRLTELAKIGKKICEEAQGAPPQS